MISKDAAVFREANGIERIGFSAHWIQLTGQSQTNIQNLSKRLLGVHQAFGVRRVFGV